MRWSKKDIWYAHVSISNKKTTKFGTSFDNFYQVKLSYGLNMKILHQGLLKYPIYVENKSSLYSRCFSDEKSRRIAPFDVVLKEVFFVKSKQNSFRLKRNEFLHTDTSRTIYAVTKFITTCFELRFDTMKMYLGWY